MNELPRWLTPVSRMLKRGLVARRDRPEDGRGTFVAITPEGRK
jgi:DNA-binding MarR family transcriptional regulator